MTTVKFFHKDGKLNGFEIKGHALFSDSGSDIVCSAISSASIMAVNTVTEVIGDEAQVKSDEGFLSLVIENPSDKSVCVIEGFKIHMNQFSEQYPQNIRILNGGN